MGVGGMALPETLGGLRDRVAPGLTWWTTVATLGLSGGGWGEGWLGVTSVPFWCAVNA